MIQTIKLLKRTAKHFLGKYVIPDISKQVEDNLIHHLTTDQLFYDVANFVVYNQIPGDYLEFGVYEGDGFALMYKYLFLQWTTYQVHAKVYGHECDNFFWESKRFFAFDSFEGLPEAKSPDTPTHFSKRGVYQVPIERFCANVEAKGVDMSKVTAIPGWFERTLTNQLKASHDITSASVIFIDCDLYESALPIFRFITSLIQDGTVIIIDDFFRYKGHPNKGIQKAFTGWLECSPCIRTSELTRCSANRVAFVCHLDE